MSVLDGMLDVGHNVFMGVCFSSFQLVKCLAQSRTNCTELINSKEKSYPRNSGSVTCERGNYSKIR